MADPQLRMNFQNALAAKLASPIPGTIVGSVDDVTSLLAEMLLSNAADIAPPVRRKQVPRGRCATEETKAKFNAQWGRIGKTRGNGSVLLHTIVAYGEP